MKTTNTTLQTADTEQLVADLAWDFCEKRRKGGKVPMKKYLERCPTKKSRDAFKTLVNTDLLVGLALQEHARAGRSELANSRAL